MFNGHIFIFLLFIIVIKIYFVYYALRGLWELTGMWSENTNNIISYWYRLIPFQPESWTSNAAFEVCQKAVKQALYGF